MQVFNTDLGTALQYFVALFWPLIKDLLLVYCKVKKLPLLETISSVKHLCQKLKNTK